MLPACRIPNVHVERRLRRRDIVGHRYVIGPKIRDPVMHRVIGERIRRPIEVGGIFPVEVREGKTDIEMVDRLRSHIGVRRRNDVVLIADERARQCILVRVPVREEHVEVLLARQDDRVGGARKLRMAAVLVVLADPHQCVERWRFLSELNRDTEELAEPRRLLRRSEIVDVDE